MIPRRRSTRTRRAIQSDLTGRSGMSRYATRIWLGKLCRICGAVALLVNSALPPAIAQGEPPSGGKAVVITIDSDINDVMRDSMFRRVDAALEQGATTLIFEIDTYGGLVTSALEMHDLILKQPDRVRTIAWINQKAYSAGALIAVAADEIWMTKAADIGDCAPIIMGQSELGEAERAKAESPVLSAFRDAAVQNGYPRMLCEAMVRVGIEVWWIEKIQPDENGVHERRFVDTETKRELLEEEDEDGTFSGLLSGRGDAEWRLVETYIDPISGREDKLIQPVDPESELLTLSTSKAIVYGFANGIASDLTELRQELGLQLQPERVTTSGWEMFLMWLNHPGVRGVFFVLMLLGGYIEFQNPGLLLPGSVALVSAVIFFGAPYAAGLADTWELILLVIGIVLLLVEVFVLPGFGIAGILGACCVLIALVGTFVGGEPVDPDQWLPAVPTLENTWQQLKWGLLVVVGGFAVSLIGLVLLASYLPSMPVARSLAPGNPEQITLAPHDPTEEVARVGDVGVVIGDLKPGGQARFGNEIIEVASQGAYVAVGEKVQVIRRDGMNIVVRPLGESKPLS